MMTNKLEQFYKRWLDKADTYEGSILTHHFDRFTSLYVLYNSLYMVISELRIQNLGIPKDSENSSDNNCEEQCDELQVPRFNDYKAATSYVVEYLKADLLIDGLFNKDDRAQKCLSEICELLKVKFNIILKWGKAQPTKDAILLRHLNSDSNNAKAVAILSLFYYIRCNLFHGHKDFEEVQRKLLIPVNELLRKTVEITYKKLSVSG